MKKYRKKPIVIEAVRYNGKNLEEILVWSGLAEIGNDFLGNKLFIPTLEGEMEASVGDYIIKGIKGEFYPCKPDIFEASYEVVND